MGDVAMSVPVLRAFTEQYPDVKLTVVSRAFFEPFFKDLKQVDFYAADLKGEHKGILGLYKLSKTLKAIGFDAVADLHNVLRSKILKFFFGSKQVVQIDKGRAEKKALTTGRSFEQLKTTHQRYADVFEKLGLPIDLSKPSFPEKAVLSSDLQSYMSSSEKQSIGIAPFAAHQSKMYPLEQMEAVIAQLAKHYHIILFGGGRKEVEYLKTVEGKFDDVHSVAGTLSLEEELAIISNLDVMLSMDSGNGHLAAMLGVKVISVWGVTHPYAGFAPFNQPNDYALVADRTQYPQIPTSVYGNKFPEGYKQAAGSISVADIVSKVESIL